MNDVKIYDCTLRDGNHKLKHKINLEQISEYVKGIDELGVDFIEVGHGNGLSASSYLIGLSTYSDEEIIKTAKKNIKNACLSIFVIPGFANHDEIRNAVKWGVGHIRIGVLATEYDLSSSYIDLCVELNISFEISLMFAHLLTYDIIKNLSSYLKKYNIKKINLMDSVGILMPEDINDIVKAINNNLRDNIEIGFHAHNNLGMAISNSISAIKIGCSQIDGTILGIGGGAGNTSLEQFVTVSKLSGIKLNISEIEILELAEKSKRIFNINPPSIQPINVGMAKNKLFGGFQSKIEERCGKNNYKIQKFISELNKYNLVPGQEYIIDSIDFEDKKQIKNEK